jgi:hypothetical protein
MNELIIRQGQVFETELRTRAEPDRCPTAFPSNKSIVQMKMAYAMALRLKMPKGAANGQTKLFI